jgi:hypothetical protein
MVLALLNPLFLVLGIKAIRVSNASSVSENRLVNVDLKTAFFKKINF